MSSGKAKIVLVDTDLGTLRLLEEVFTQIDHTLKIDMVLNARSMIRYLNGQVNESSLRQIILVHRMPVLNAVDVLESIKKRMPSLSLNKTVIALQNENFLRERCLQAGATAYFEMPEAPSAVKSLARRVLDFVRE